MAHQVSQKAQYALRVLFELATRHGNGPIKIGYLARAQSIPVRFLEVILAQLKKGGFVRSHRGQDGGCELARSPETVRVGDVLRFVDGSLAPIPALDSPPRSQASTLRRVAFIEMWEQAHAAITHVYDETSLADLIAQEERRRGDGGPSYSI